MMKRMTLGLGALALLWGAGTASAVPITLPSGPISFQFNNAEQIDVSGANGITCVSLGLPASCAPGGNMDNWGILKISVAQRGVVNLGDDHTLISGGGATFFVDQIPGPLGGQITGVFYGVDTQLSCPALTPPFPAGPATCATGGTIDLYWNDFGVNVLGTPSSFAPNSTTVGLFTTGTFLARLNFDSGILNNPSTTVISDVNLLGPVSTAGTANAFASVNVAAGGAWAAQLNQDWFFVDTDNDGIKGEVGETRDVRFRNNFNALPSWNGAGPIQGFSSSDPATNFAGEVPEPATLTLFGLGLAALARRRKKA